MAVPSGAGPQTYLAQTRPASQRGGAGTVGKDPSRPKNSEPRNRNLPQKFFEGKSTEALGDIKTAWQRTLRAGQAAANEGL